MSTLRSGRFPSGTQVWDLLEFVRKHSPFYAESWNGFCDGSREKQEEDIVETLTGLPVTDHEEFWRANTCLDSKVVTSKQKDGIIFKTGGTTASPKVSFYSQTEFQLVNKQLAESLRRCGVGAGDKVANLFYAGDLYGSFLLHVLSVYHLPEGAIQIPIAGHVGVESMQHHITEFQATVILGTVTTMSKIAERIVQAGTTATYVRLLLFSGEAFYEDQSALLRTAFPTAAIRSVVYGSMDCGVIGLPPADGLYDGDHRVHEINRPNIIEIINDEGKVTTEAGEAGSLVFTNLERRLMPVVRYPSGDRAAWVDYDRGLFRILDRDRTAIRLGPVSIDLADLRRVVKAAMPDGAVVGGIQAVVTRKDRMDLLTLVVAYDPPTSDEAATLQASITQGLVLARPMFQEEVGKGLVNPLQVDFVSMGDLTANPRTGKIMEVLDLRSTTIADKPS